MGGCRCTFRSCNVTTPKFPGMHFFHYPVKDPERLEAWINYADYPCVRDLSPAQARNRNVCALHFRDECFMNFKKDRLTPTAVPTLMRLRNGLVLDYATSDNPKPTALPPTLEKHLIPPKGYVVLGLPADYFSSSSSTVEEEIEKISKPRMRLVTHITKPQLTKRTSMPIQNILNKRARLDSRSSLNDALECNDSSIITLSRVALKDGDGDDEEDVEEYGLLIDDDKPDMSIEPVSTTTVAAGDCEELETVEIDEDEIDIVNEIKFLHVDKEDTVEGAHVVSSDLFNQTVETLENEIVELRQDSDKKEFEAEERIARLEAELTETKDKLQQALDRAVSAEYEAKRCAALLSECNAANETLSKAYIAPKTQSPATLTKPQLFNGIKKYLTASMTSLVRMEMFGGPERLWKPDEKQVSVELLRLGANVYKYFSDEWRFRLPPRKMVEIWTTEVKVEEEEDL